MTSIRSSGGNKAGLPTWYNGYIHQFRTTSLPRTKKEREQLLSIVADEGKRRILGLPHYTFQRMCFYRWFD